MKWSLKLGTVAGIPVYVHATFALLLGWIAVVHWMAGGTVSAALAGMVFVLAIFACVVLHELGHALAARRFGVPTRDITLYPIGGLARLERMPEKPSEELWVALAGPAVNVAIAAALALALFITSSFEPLQTIGVAQGSFLERLMAVNLLLIVFNMIPAFPMDGGRVLRAVLAMRMNYARATNIAARIGRAFALVFAAVGFFFNPFLVVIAFFVWIGAGQEAGFTRMRDAFDDVPVSQVMHTRFAVLHPEDTLGHAVDLSLAGGQKDFPVIAWERVVGVLTEDRLMNAIAATGGSVRVGDVMATDFPSVDPDTPLASVIPAMISKRARLVPVHRNGRLAGILTGDAVRRFLEIQRRLTARGHRNVVTGAAPADTTREAPTSPF